MIGYFRECTRDLPQRSQYLRSLLNKKASFLWSDQHEAEFKDLNAALFSMEMILYHPDWDGKFKVHIDASRVGCVAMLEQQHIGQFVLLLKHLHPQTTNN